MHQVLEEDIEIIEFLNSLIKSEDEISIDIPPCYTPKSRNEIIHLLLDWCFYNSEEDFKKYVKQQDNGSVEIIGWSTIDRLISRIQSDIAQIAVRGEDFFEMENWVRDILLELLSVGWPFECTILEDPNGDLYLKGPYVLPNRKMEKFTFTASMNLIINKGKKWFFFLEQGLEYYGYLIDQKIWLDPIMVDLLKLTAGDKVEVRLFMEKRVIRAQYLKDVDGRIYHFRKVINENLQ